jgi:hypothetical protein
MAYTREMTRLWGFALALVISGAPLAPAICGMTCASHDMTSMAPPSEHHSCHESAPDGAIAVPVPHACGHDSDGTIAPQELIQLLVSVGLAETPVVALVSLDPPTRIVITSHIEHDPPGLSALISPLRV